MPQTKGPNLVFLNASLGVLGNLGDTLISPVWWVIYCALHNVLDSAGNSRHNFLKNKISYFIRISKIVIRTLAFMMYYFSHLVSFEREWKLWVLATLPSHSDFPIWWTRVLLVLFNINGINTHSVENVHWGFIDLRNIMKIKLNVDAFLKVEVVHLMCLPKFRGKRV